jgi:hypothetical protein
VGGDLVGIIGRPGHLKTTLAVFLAKKVARELQPTDQVVVYVTADEAVEQIEEMIEAGPGLTLTDRVFGRVDGEVAKRVAMERVRLPIWVVGESVGGEGAAPLTFPNLYGALEVMRTGYEGSPRPGLVVIDYIQSILYGRPTERVVEVTDAIVNAKGLARRMGCPVVMCVQASRAVDRAVSKIPTAADCQWSSAIEQQARVLLSLWYPVKTEGGEFVRLAIEGAARSVPVRPDALVVRVEKQKGGRSGVNVLLRVQPEVVTVGEWG